MILAESELRKALDEGLIRLTPSVPYGNVGAASIDLRLSNQFLLIHQVMDAQREVGVDASIDVARYSFSKFQSVFGKRCDVADGSHFDLDQHQLVLGYTKEEIYLSDSLAGRIEGKSSLARLGLFIHITAPFIHPGFHNQLQLELYNVGPAPIRLRPGREVCQLIVERVEGTGTYEGQFQRSVGGR